MFDDPERLRMIVRTVHYASSAGLFGLFTFSLATGTRSRSRPPLTGDDGAPQRLALAGAAWLAVVVASGALWLGIEAAVMSGRSLGEALGSDTLGVVLRQTLFGRLWMLRAVLAAALVAALVALGRMDRGDVRGVWPCALLAGALIASLAWAGHANVERGIDRVVHHTVDALHLLAAGAWLGGLVPLVRVLTRAGHSTRPAAFDVAARAARRFSTLGVVCVCTLAGTGFVNASYTVGSLAALGDTAYGRLLLGKLTLFLLMLVPAAWNRTRLTPLLAGTTASAEERERAVRGLRRNALIEVAAGLALLGIVGVLGVMPPAIHGEAPN